MGYAILYLILKHSETLEDDQQICYESTVNRLL